MSEQWEIVIFFEGSREEAETIQMMLAGQRGFCDVQVCKVTPTPPVQHEKEDR